MSKTRAFLITVNNPEKSDYAALDALKKYTYLVWANEIGKENKTPHFHAYFRYETPHTLSSVKCQFPRAHIDIPVGKPAQIRHYVCKLNDKEDPAEKPADEIHEFGKLPSQGNRTDLETVAQQIIQDRAPLSQIAIEQPALFIQYNRGLQALKSATFTDRDKDIPPTVTWIWGLTGTGKTRYAYDHYPTNEIYKKDSSIWWDGYQQQQVILIDDFAGTHTEIAYRDLLNLLDRYPYSGQYKGGYVKINSPQIFITCEYPPMHFWSGNQLEQIVRRLSAVVHLE